MNTGLHYDDEAARRLVAIYTTPDVEAQRRQVLQALALGPGEQVLDVGSGPGLLASLIGEAVGSDGWVCGIDISEPLLALSRSQAAHQPWVEFRQADATRLPFADQHFDAAVSTQVYEYVLQVETAVAELYRVLRSGGRALILDTDWDSMVWHSPNPARMKRILAAWTEHCADPHLPRTLASRLRQAGFTLEHRQVIPLFNPEFDPNSYSHTILELIAAFVPGRQGITAEEAQDWADELRQFGAGGEYFFSLNRYLFLARKP